MRNGIHTICYEPGMADVIDPAFLPFDVTADPQPERREMAHMLAFWRQGSHRKFRISGLLSSKFGEKTGFNGAIFNDFIDTSPGYDVWFVNPYPAWLYLSYNIWEQGEACHPGLWERTVQVFKAAKIELDLRDFPRSKVNTLIFSNYWAATENFWDRFMPFVENIAAHADKMPSMSDPTFYGVHKINFFPFLFERLLTTFLVLHPDINVKYLKFELPHISEMCINKIDKLLLREWAPLIDRWDAVGTYSEDQRVTFRSLQKLKIFGHWQNNPAILKHFLDI